MQTFSDGLFSFNVEKLWELSKEIEEEWISIELLADQLKDECWGISPWEIYEIFQDNISGAHLDRILNADLNYPILLTPHGHVCDGMHRLAKAKYFLKNSQVKIKRFEEWIDMLPAKL